MSSGIKIKDWIKLLSSVDYGIASVSDTIADAMLAIIEQVAFEMANLGLDTKKINLAIRTFRTDPESSKGYLFGPAKTGNGRGVIDDLIYLEYNSVLYKSYRYLPIDQLQ